MSLDYEFAPIDVDIITHPRVADIDKSIRSAAFGLWVWGQCYARLHKTGGFLKRSAVLVALAVGEAVNMKLAGALHACGLWVERPDFSGWDIHNFERKAGGRSPGAERTARYRSKRQSSPPPPSHEASHVTSPVTPLVTTSDVTGVTSASYSPSFSSSESSSGERERGLRPEWFDEVLSTIEMTCEPIADPGAAWLRYRGHRAKKREPMGREDAEYWLTTVVVAEQRKERELARERKDRKPWQKPEPAEMTPEDRAKRARALAEAMANRKVGT